MKKNVGPVDRGLRILLGSVLLSLAYFSEPPAAYLGWAGLITLIALTTGAAGWRPPYALFKKQNPGPI